MTRRHFIPLRKYYEPYNIPIDGLLMWLDASQLSGYNDDDPVDAFTDLSGNGNSPAAVTTERPTYKTNIINGKPAILFDGSDDNMQVSWDGGNQSQPITGFIVYKRVIGTITTAKFLFDSNNDAINRAAISFNPSGTATLTRLYAGETTAQFTDVITSTPRVHTFVLDGATSKQWIKGVLKVTNNAGGNASNGLTIGARYNESAGNFLKFYLCEMIFYSGDKSSYQSEIEAYLASKWGIIPEFNISVASDYGEQGLVTDGTYIYTSGSDYIRKYDLSGNVIATIGPRAGTNDHYGDLELAGGYLYSVLFDYLTGPTNVTKVLRFNTDLTGEIEILDISSSVGNGGNGLVYKDGFWFVGETGGSVTNFDQHIYIFDDDWNYVKTIDANYDQGIGIQSLTFRDNVLYALEHDSTLIKFTWDSIGVDLTYVSIDSLIENYYEGISWDDVNQRFYIYDMINEAVVSETTLP